MITNPYNYCMPTIMWVKLKYMKRRKDVHIQT